MSRISMRWHMVKRAKRMLYGEEALLQFNQFADELTTTLKMVGFKQGKTLLVRVTLL